MIKIVIVKNATMNFLDAKTKRQQWYCSDVTPGNKFDFKDIVDVGYDNRATFECHDGEYATLGIDSFLFSDVSYLKG